MNCFPTWISAKYYGCTIQRRLAFGDIWWHRIWNHLSMINFGEWKYEPCIITSKLKNQNNGLIPVLLLIIMEFSSNMVWNSSSQFELYSNWSCWQVLLNHGQALAFDEIDTKSTIDNRYVAQPALILCLLIEQKALYILRLLAIALEARKNGKIVTLENHSTIASQNNNLLFVKLKVICTVLSLILVNNKTYVTGL